MKNFPEALTTTPENGEGTFPETPLTELRPGLGPSIPDVAFGPRLTSGVSVSTLPKLALSDGYWTSRSDLIALEEEGCPGITLWGDLRSSELEQTP